jgi:4-hydroxybenzoyl-CoA reductase subunit beta
MILPPFELHEPKTVEEAIALKIRFGKGADFVAGGTDLLCNYKYELNAKPHLVSLRDVDELRSFDTRRIGACAVLDDVKDDPAIRHELPVISEAILTISSHLLRQTGTFGGNLLADTRCFWFNQSRFWRESIGSCLKAEADVCRVVWGAHECVAVYSGDLAPVLITLGCSVTIAGPTGRRVVPLDRFFQHDGIKRHVLAPDEMLVDVRFPDDARSWAAGYEKLRTRESFDFPVLGVAVALKAERGRLAAARVCLGAVHTTPLVRDEAVKPFLGRVVDEACAAEVGAAVADGLTIHHNTAMSPPYRRRMASVFTKRLFARLSAGRAASAV